MAPKKRKLETQDSDCSLSDDDEKMDEKMMKKKKQKKDSGSGTDSSSGRDKKKNKKKKKNTKKKHEATDADTPASSSSTSRGVSKDKAVPLSEKTMVSTQVDSPKNLSVKILVANKVELVEWLSHDLHIVQHMYKDGIIEARVYRKLMNIAQPEEACIQLIDTVTNKGEETSSQFLKLLKKPEILVTYPQLKEWNSSFALPDQDGATGADPPSSSSTSTRGGVSKDGDFKISGHPIIFYEELLQEEMENTFLCVKLDNEPKMKLEDVCVPIYNIKTSITNMLKHHEVRQMEMNNALQGKPIEMSELFKDPSGINERTVLTVGVAGIGKTFLVHNFIRDWTLKCFPQDPHLLFPLNFRQLNLLEGKSFSLSELIHECIVDTRCIEKNNLDDIFTKMQKSRVYNRSPFKVMFAFDGLDENRLPLRFPKDDFSGQVIKPDQVTKSFPVEVLLVNLLTGKLLPSAHIWMTSRPAAVDQIPEDVVDKMTEVRGFITDDQKMQYFKKRFMIFSDDEDQASSKANLIMSHIKKSKTLSTMCEIPVFCRIFAFVVQHRTMTDKLPETLVEMYSQFLTAQTKQKEKKYGASGETSKERLMEAEAEVLLKLGKLAFDQLVKNNILFYQKDLEACGLDLNDVLKSGTCTAFFRADGAYFHRTNYCFVHLSIQEFLAAVYLYHCFTQRNMDVLAEFLEGSSSDSDSLSDFLKAAMVKTQQSESGHLDLFVRFLHGLALESNQSLLGGLLGQTDQNSPQEIQKAIDNLKEMNTENISPDKCINIFQCLMEMKDPSLSQGIQQYLESENRSGKRLSETQFSALATILQMSAEVLDELDLDKYNKSHGQDRRRLVPAVRNVRKARLVDVGLDETHCEVVASALSSNPSHLKELDLSYNDLGKRVSLKWLCAGLKSSHCCLEILRLVDNDLGETHCEDLASALSSNPSHLKELDLSSNNLWKGDSLEKLCAGLKSPHCCLEILRLTNCWLSERSCEVLASALRSNPSLHLKELDLRFNVLNDSALQLFSGLKTLQVKHGGHEDWLNPQLLTRYFCRLTLDTNTASRHLSLSENNRKVTRVTPALDGNALYIPRLDLLGQVLCTEGLTGRCYWEVERSGGVSIAVTYREISDACELGFNEKSWSLAYNDGDFVNRYSVIHNSKRTYLPSGPNKEAVDEDSEDRVSRVAVYLDFPAGTLSFYEVSSDTLTHLYTFQNTFTEPLYAGFMLYFDSSVCLCEQRQSLCEDHFRSPWLLNIF